MPYYAWQGVTLAGTVRRGKMFAQSREHLDKLLFEQEIALLKAKHVSVWSISGVPIATRLLFFDSLKHLLKAGLRLPDSLRVLSEQQSSSVQFQAAIYAIAHDIDHGKSLRVAFQAYPAWIDEITVAMLQIGQESGSLPRALELITHRLHCSIQWRKKIKAAALMPIITLAFFCAVVALVFVIIIPSFSSLLASRKEALPLFTHILLRMSKAMTNGRFMFWSISAAALLAVAARCAIKTSRGRKALDFLLLHIPFVSLLIRMKEYALFFQALSLVMQQGGHIAIAFPLARGTVRNWYVRQELYLLEQDVMSGTSLHKAMRTHNFFSPESCALVGIGEETGSLSIMLEQVSRAYQERVDKQLATMTTLFQPLLLLALGLLVAALIFAIYIPLFQMPDSYTFM